MPRTKGRTSASAIHPGFRSPRRQCEWCRARLAIGFVTDARRVLPRPQPTQLVWLRLSLTLHAIEKEPHHDLVDHGETPHIGSTGHGGFGMMRDAVRETTAAVGRVAATDTESTTNGFDTFVDALPRIGIGLGVVLVAWLTSRLLRRFVQPRLAASRTESFGRVVTKLIGYLIVAVGVLIAAVIVFPTFKPVDVLAGLGVFSIAIGFAFQDILSNLLAGILLLIRQPFHSGDQIEVSGQRGTVEQITIRETQIRTFDGEKVLIPNAEVYQNVIRVQTAYGPKRTTISIGLDDWEDLDRAADVVLGAIGDIDGVESEPTPQAYFAEFGESTTNLDLRYWTQPEQAEVRRVQDQVIRRVGAALKQADISMPSPVRELDVRSSVSDLVDGASDGS